MKRNLEPARPKNPKEANVTQQVVPIGNRVISCEGCKIGDEEQVEEQLYAVCFVPLGEDEIIMIGTDQGRFNQWSRFMQPFEMLLCVAVSLLAALSITWTGDQQHTHLSITGSQ